MEHDHTPFSLPSQGLWREEQAAESRGQSQAPSEVGSVGPSVSYSTCSSRASRGLSGRKKRQLDQLFEKEIDDEGCANILKIDVNLVRQYHQQLQDGDLVSAEVGLSGREQDQLRQLFSRSLTVDVCADILHVDAGLVREFKAREEAAAEEERRRMEAAQARWPALADLFRTAEHWAQRGLGPEACAQAARLADYATHGLADYATQVAQKPGVQVAAVSSVAGASLGAVAGAGAGALTGGLLGAAAGAVPAPFTLGASIPAGFGLGAFLGLFLGAVAGVSLGAFAGGVTGYACFCCRGELAGARTTALAALGRGGRFAQARGQSLAARVRAFAVAVSEELAAEKVAR